MLTQNTQLEKIIQVEEKEIAIFKKIKIFSVWKKLQERYQNPCKLFFNS